MVSSSAALQPPSEYHQFRQLRHTDIDPHLIGVQLDRLSDLENHQGRSGLPQFLVVAPGVVSVTFENDTATLAALGPAIFQLRGRGEVVWNAHEMTPGWRLRELKWYADEMSLLDASDIDLIVDSAYIPQVADRSRGRRVTGPTPRTLCSAEPELVVLGRGRYRLTFPGRPEAPSWWTHPVDIDIREEIIVNHHGDTPQWRFDEIREYVNLLADIHLEAIIEDPELIGASVGGRKGTGTLRRSTWSPRAVRKANTADHLAMQMDNLAMEVTAPRGGPRRASEPLPRFTPGKTLLTAEPIQEVESTVLCDIVGHGTFALSWSDRGEDLSERWATFPARVQLMQDGAALDVHKDTPQQIRRAFTSAAVDLFLKATPAMDEISRVAALSLRDYPFLDALLPRPSQVHFQDLPTVSHNFCRGIIDIYCKTAPPSLPDPLPRLVLVEAPKNIYRLQSPNESLTEPDSGQAFDLTPSSAVTTKLSAVPVAQIDRDTLYMYAISELAGVRENAPPSLIEMFDAATLMEKALPPSPPRSEPVSPVVEMPTETHDEKRVESTTDLVGVGILDVHFPSLDTTVRVYFVDETRCHFDLPDHTSVSRVSELTTALEHSLGTQLEAWGNIRSVVHEYAPRLPVTELHAKLPELQPGMARLAFTPRVRTATPAKPSRDALPKLCYRKGGVYELEWPTTLGVSATRYSFNNGKIELRIHSRTPERCMVMWLGVVIKTLFESGLSPASPALPPFVQNPKRASYVPSMYSPPQSPGFSISAPGLVPFPVPATSPPLANTTPNPPVVIQIPPTTSFPVPQIHSLPSSPRRPPSTDSSSATHSSAAHSQASLSSLSSQATVAFPVAEPRGVQASPRPTSWHPPATMQPIQFGSVSFPQPHSAATNKSHQSSIDTSRESASSSQGVEPFPTPTIGPDRRLNPSPLAQPHLRGNSPRLSFQGGLEHTSPVNGRPLSSLDMPRSASRSPVSGRPLSSMEPPRSGRSPVNGGPLTSMGPPRSTNASPLLSAPGVPPRTSSITPSRDTHLLQHSPGNGTRLTSLHMPHHSLPGGPQQMPQGAPQQMPQGAPQHMPQQMPQHMPQGVPHAHALAAQPNTEVIRPHTQISHPNSHTSIEHQLKHGHHHSMHAAIPSQGPHPASKLAHLSHHGPHVRPYPVTARPNLQAPPQNQSPQVNHQSPHLNHQRPHMQQAPHQQQPARPHMQGAHPSPPHHYMYATHATHATNDQHHNMQAARPNMPLLNRQGFPQASVQGSAPRGRPASHYR